MFWKNSALKVKKVAIVSGNITKLWRSLLRSKASYLHIFHLLHRVDEICVNRYGYIDTICCGF